MGTYEEEHWDYLPEPLLTLWCECSRKLGDKELTIRLLLAILSGMHLIARDWRVQLTPGLPDTRRSTTERSSAGDELREILEVQLASVYLI